MLKNYQFILLSLLSVQLSSFSLAEDKNNPNDITIYDQQFLVAPILKGAFKFDNTIVLALEKAGPITEFVGVDFSSNKVLWRLEEDARSDPFKLGNLVFTRNKILVPQDGKIKHSSSSKFLTFKKAGKFALAFSDATKTLYTFSPKGKMLRKTNYKGGFMGSFYQLDNGNLLTIDRDRAQIKNPLGKRVWKTTLRRNPQLNHSRITIMEPEGEMFILQYSTGVKPFFRFIKPKSIRVFTIPKKIAGKYEYFGGIPSDVFRRNKKWKCTIIDTTKGTICCIDVKTEKLDYLFKFTQTLRVLPHGHAFYQNKIIDLSNGRAVLNLPKGQTALMDDKSFHLTDDAVHFISFEKDQTHHFNFINLKTKETWKAPKPFKYKIETTPVEGKENLVVVVPSAIPTLLPVGLIDLKAMQMKPIGEIPAHDSASLLKCWIEGDKFIGIFSDQQVAEKTRRMGVQSFTISK